MEKKYILIPVDDVISDEEIKRLMDKVKALEDAFNHVLNRIVEPAVKAKEY
jgi:hypothetical protein